MSENRFPKTTKEISFFGALNFADRSKHAASVDTVPVVVATPTTPLSKCRSPKFFRTQSFAILSPKLSRKFFHNNNNDGSTSGSVPAISGGSLRMNRLTHSLKNFAREKSQHILPQPAVATNLKSATSSVGSNCYLSEAEIIDENCEFIVEKQTKAPCERVEIWRQHMRRASISMEENSRKLENRR